jgi:hypothetical protein
MYTFAKTICATRLRNNDICTQHRYCIASMLMIVRKKTLIEKYYVQVYLWKCENKKDNSKFYFLQVDIRFVRSLWTGNIKICFIYGSESHLYSKSLISNLPATSMVQLYISSAHRWALYPWSAISDWAWYQNFRYWTERAESNIISDIESFIQYPTSQYKLSGSVAQFYSARLSVMGARVLFCIEEFFFNIGYRNELWYRYRNTSDIGMTFFSPTYLSPISEEQMSMSDVGYPRYSDRCRCPHMPQHVWFSN